jgi:hypothetical protein
MQQSPVLKAESHSVDQEIPLLLWNLKVHYRIYNIPPRYGIQIHMNPLYILVPYVIAIYLILSFYLSVVFPFRFAF